MSSAYRKLYGLLDRRGRRRAVIVFLLMLAVAIGEVAGVASIMPFIAVLSNPSVLETNRYLSAVYGALGFESRDNFLLAMGIAVFVVLVGSLALKALGTWAQLRFTFNRSREWSGRLVAGYLRQPYEWFLNRNSSDLATATLAEVNQVVTGSLVPALQLLANGLVAVLLLALLVAVDPLLAISAAIIIGGAYGAVFALLKKKLGRIGVERRTANRQRFRIVSEVFGGVKDIKVAGLEEASLRRFDAAAQILASRQIAAGMASQLPNFAMQAILFGGMLLAILYLMRNFGGFQQALPVAALYAFAGYRLMPAMQVLYQQATTIRFSEPALDALCRDFATLPGTSPDHGRVSTKRAEGLPLLNSVELVAVSYRYPGSEMPALDSVSIQIPARGSVGLVGTTGSGKTTTVDIILGLLRPTSGELRVDGMVVADADVRSWQASVGYVPQYIYLADDTVEANIAFGVPAARIDPAAVEAAARVARLHDFVMEQLPDGYQTRVGERGVRLSGGQRQRIGIARALYHDPHLLIMDEATSALDTLTEQAVMDAVHALAHKKTIILIAHRLSTVRDCDQIFLLEGGRVAGSGTYASLEEGNAQFRAMTGSA